MNNHTYRIQQSRPKCGDCGKMMTYKILAKGKFFVCKLPCRGKMIAKKYAISAPLSVRRKRYEAHRILEKIFKDTNILYIWVEETVGVRHISQMDSEHLRRLLQEANKLIQDPLKVLSWQTVRELEDFIKVKMKLLSFWIKN